MENQLVKSHNERMFAGVCGGIADATGVDPVYIRLGFVAAALVFNQTGPALLLYVLLAFVLPDGELEEGGTGHAQGGVRPLPSDRVRTTNSSPRSHSVAGPFGASTMGTRTANASISCTVCGLSQVARVVGVVGLTIGKAAFGAARVAGGAAMSAYADPRAQRAGDPAKHPQSRGSSRGSTSVSASASSPQRAPAAKPTPARSPQRTSIPTPTRKSVPVRDAGAGGSGQGQTREAAQDAWLSDEERLEADTRRRVDAELGSARSILEKTEPAKRASRRERRRARSGGRARLFMGLGLLLGGSALFVESVSGGVISQLFGSIPSGVFGAAALLWLGSLVLFSGARKRARRRRAARRS